MIAAASVERIEAIRRGDYVGRLDFAGERLIEADLSGLNLSGADLSGANLSRANLTGAQLMGANLEGAVLYEAVLDQAELTAANLKGANLEGVSGERVGMGGVQAQGASMLAARLVDSSLVAGNFNGALLTRAELRGCRLREADFTNADLTGADMRAVEMAETRVQGACFDEADLRGSVLAGVRGYTKAGWIGTDLRDINFAGAYLLRRHAMDENYLYEFKRTSTLHNVLYWLWWATSNCGRSLTRWAMVVLSQVILFAWLYGQVNVAFGDHETWLSPVYYSVVTITTLGYGDVLPASVGAQVVCMIEVVVGYLMLGGLLSIFSNKMARRAE